MISSFIYFIQIDVNSCHDLYVGLELEALYYSVHVRSLRGHVSQVKLYISTGFMLMLLLFFFLVTRGGRVFQVRILHNYVASMFHAHALSHDVAASISQPQAAASTSQAQP